MNSYLKRWNKKYVTGKITYRRWETLPVLVVGLSLAFSGNSVAGFIGVCLEVAVVVIAIKSKPVPDSGKLNENEHSDS